MTSPNSRNSKNQDDKKKRLSDALRANLQRRKAKTQTAKKERECPPSS